MTQEELNKELERHLHWLREDCDGWDKMRAVLDGENLNGLNLNGALLDGASLVEASLDHASLVGASLVGASLDHASLDLASLVEASLDHASLVGASLNWALLDHASLDHASLVGATLDHASLKGASSLNGAVFEGASLIGTCLDGAYLDGVINFPFIPFACPDTGSFIGWKKVEGKIIKLEIPADAKRCSATSNKCRCDKAKVLEIQTLDGSPSHITKIPSDFDRKFIYEVGKTVSVKDFCDDRWRECSQGIHFFINRQSAVEY